MLKRFAIFSDIKVHSNYTFQAFAFLNAPVPPPCFTVSAGNLSFTAACKSSKSWFTATSWRKKSTSAFEKRDDSEEAGWRGANAQVTEKSNVSTAESGFSCSAWRIP